MVLSKEVMTQRVGTGVARLEGVFDCIPKYRYIWFPEPEGRVWKGVSLQWNVLYKHYPEGLKVMGFLNHFWREQDSQ